MNRNNNFNAENTPPFLVEFSEFAAKYTEPNYARQKTDRVFSSIGDICSHFESMSPENVLVSIYDHYVNMFHFNDGLDNVVVLVSYRADYKKGRSEKQDIEMTIRVVGNSDSYVNSIKDRITDFIVANPVEKRIEARWAQIMPNGALDYTRMTIKNQTSFYSEVYPWIDDVEAYINDYLESSSNILILNGEPGGGKSQFINRILHKSNLKAVVAYDTEVMKRDLFFTDFITSRNLDIMILEDADLLLEGRAESGNHIMSKLLNVADGILDVSRKKFIFTANLHSTRDIDPALTRPGRCFDIMNFRPLTKSEAQAAADAIGKPLYADKTEYTVAEIFNGRANANEKLRSGKVGF